MHLSWINSQYAPDDNFVAIFASPLPPWCVLFFLFFFVACMQIFYESGKHNICEVFLSEWVCKSLFFRVAATFWFWSSDMLGSNFEKILIEVFTNRVNHTRKRWAVNNNSNCLLIELPGVSKKKLLSWFSPYFSSRGRILLFSCKRCKRYFYKGKIYILII